MFFLWSLLCRHPSKLMYMNLWYLHFLAVEIRYLPVAFVAMLDSGFWFCIVQWRTLEIQILMLLYIILIITRNYDFDGKLAMCSTWWLLLYCLYSYDMFHIDNFNVLEVFGSEMEYYLHYSSLWSGQCYVWTSLGKDRREMESGTENP